MFSYGIQAEIGTRVLDQVGRGTAILEPRGQRWVVRHTRTSISRGAQVIHHFRNERVTPG
ncbi:MAG: hypothetical protein ACR2GK_02020 [Gemmatimonadaceae bacterium]